MFQISTAGFLPNCKNLHTEHTNFRLSGYPRQNIRPVRNGHSLFSNRRIHLGVQIQLGVTYQYKLFQLIRDFTPLLHTVL